MIFGKTRAEHREAHNRKDRRREEWKRRFAWVPVRLVDGRYFWMGAYEVREVWSPGICMWKYGLGWETERRPV